MKLTTTITIEQLVIATIYAVFGRFFACLIFGFDNTDIHFLMTLAGFWLIIWCVTHWRISR